MDMVFLNKKVSAPSGLCGPGSPPRELQSARCGFLPASLVFGHSRSSGLLEGSGSCCGGIVS